MSEHDINDSLSLLAASMRDLSQDADPVQSVRHFADAVARLWGSQGFISITRRNAPPGAYRVARFFHQDGLDKSRYPDISFAGPESPHYRGGLLGEILEAERPVYIGTFENGKDAALGDQLAPYRTLVAVPVYDLGAATNWLIFLHTSPNAFSPREVELRMLQANLMGGISNAKRVSRELIEASKLIQREIDEIANIQRGLLPAILPSDHELEVAAAYETFDRAGGDFYTTYPVENGSAGALGFFIADASGHGPSAAVVVAMLAVLLDMNDGIKARPAELLAYLNEQLLKRPINHSFVTAFAGVLDRPSGRMRYASAGHPPPFVRDSGGTVSLVPAAQGLPLAIFSDSAYEERDIVLNPGDAALLYTDGMTEAANPAGAMFGESGLAEAFAQTKGGAQDMLEGIQAAMASFTLGVRPRDDQTMLVIRRT
jgi:phosphoserine phosphatase RsbU/P